jgi:hypothetical protein
MRKLLLLFLLFPCTVSAFWPLSWELDKERRYLGPLVSYRGDEERTELTIRPFLFSYDSKDGGSYDFLYPFGHSRPGKSYLVPFYLSKEFEGEKDTSVLFFFGGTSKKGDYYGFFPFAGRLYNRYGKDDMGFFLWPLYSYTDAEGATKKNFLWPFFSVYGGKDRGGKFWPIYGTREREGERKASFFLWPVFFWEQKDLDTHEPFSSFWAFPFYTRTTSATKAYYNVLFPLFSYSRTEDKRHYGFLFSLFSRTIGEETHGFNFFPFVMYSKNDRDTTLTALWPVFKRSEWYARDEVFLETRFLVINRSIEEKGGRFVNIWPLFEYREAGDSSTFFFPSILPIRIEGYDRIIRPLLTLYEQKKTDTKSVVNLLYGLYTNEEEGENWKRRFAFLFEAKKEDGQYGFELLSGLFGVDAKRVKVFFIPFKRD